MHCYMCDRDGRAQVAVAVCPDCFVGLCADHLAQEFQHPRTEPHYTCSHPSPTATASGRVERGPAAGR
jgi:hypothetical protein